MKVQTSFIVVIYIFITNCSCKLISIQINKDLENSKESDESGDKTINIVINKNNQTHSNIPVTSDSIEHYKDTVIQGLKQHKKGKTKRHEEQKNSMEETRGVWAERRGTDNNGGKMLSERDGDIYSDKVMNFENMRQVPTARALQYPSVNSDNERGGVPQQPPKKPKRKRVSEEEEQAKKKQNKHKKSTKKMKSTAKHDKKSTDEESTPLGYENSAELKTQLLKMLHYGGGGGKKNPDVDNIFPSEPYSEQKRFEVEDVSEVPDPELERKTRERDSLLRELIDLEKKRLEEARRDIVTPEDTTNSIQMLQDDKALRQLIDTEKERLEEAKIQLPDTADSYKKIVEEEKLLRQLIESEKNKLAEARMHLPLVNNPETSKFGHVHSHSHETMESEKQKLEELRMSETAALIDEEKMLRQGADSENDNMHEEESILLPPKEEESRKSESHTDNEQTIDQAGQGSGDNEHHSDREDQESNEREDVAKLDDNYAFSASIQKKGAHYASGALIGPRWVLSSAAEFYNVRETIRLFQVRVGSVSCKRGGATSHLQALEVHPRYSPGEPAFDVALLRTADPIGDSPLAKPIKLSTVTGKIVSAQFLTTYWPRIVAKDGVVPVKAKERVLHHNMRVSTQKLVPTAQCRQLMRAANVSLEDNTLCLRRIIIHHSLCTPDAGAPVVADDGLWGITSSWVSDQCPYVVLHTLVTRVSAPAVRTWIEEQMRQ